MATTWLSKRASSITHIGLVRGNYLIYSTRNVRRIVLIYFEKSSAQLRNKNPEELTVENFRV